MDKTRQIIEPYIKEYFNFFEDTLLNIGVSMIMYHKLQRQTEILLKWLMPYRAIGYVEAVTGFGKTYLAIFAIKRLHSKNHNAKIIVVVPSIKIANDWNSPTGYIQEFNLYNVEVYVVNTYTMMLDTEEKICDLLICDELHNYCSSDAKYFNTVLNSTKYSYFLGLTATLNVEERKFLEIVGIPRVDEVSIMEANNNGYISDFDVYNVALQLSDIDKSKYSQYNEDHNTYFKKFSYYPDPKLNFDLARACLSSMYQTTSINGVNKNGQQWREWYAREQGYNGDPSHFYSPKNLVIYAKKWQEAMRNRKTFLDTHIVKINFVRDLVNTLNKKTICFSESTDFASSVANLLGENICLPYHTNIDSRIVKVEKLETRKRLDAAKRLANKYGVTVSNKNENGDYEIRYSKDIKESGKAQAKIALNKFINNKIRVLSTAKALDEGADIPDIELVVTSSGSSKRRQYIQRIGRGLRFIEGKKTIIVNLYIEETKDESWLNLRQKGSRKPTKVNSLEELINKINEKDGIKITDLLFSSDEQNNITDESNSN